MSGICGWVGRADPAILRAMLDRISYRGDGEDRWTNDRAAIGYRWHKGRPGKSRGVHQAGDDVVAAAGTLAPAVKDPADALLGHLSGRAPVAGLDGAFAAAWWDDKRRRMTLVRDPFGVRSLYHVTHAGVWYFATELKQLLAIPDLPIEMDPAAIHKYLTFSFVPGEDVPIRGVKRVLPGSTLVYERGAVASSSYVELREAIDPALAARGAAARAVREACRSAVARRMNGESDMGVYLSGGIDSSAVAHWLKEAGARPKLLSLDFGAASVEKAQAAAVAEHLGLEHEFFPASGEEIGAAWDDLVWKMDLPFGDAVVGPHYLLARAARSRGLSAVWNGEGGDQFFGGWSNKPMIASSLYGPMFEERSEEEEYLKSYHRFYGLEDELYAPAFREAVGGPGQRRAHLSAIFASERAETFFGRMRLADIHLKGSQNILPRAERMANAWSCDARVPLFDRALAELSFRLPPEMKLQGACEKFILKWVLRKDLPEEIVWRKKYGMSVPVTDWVLGPLASRMADLLGPESVARRGLFRSEYVDRLREGKNDPQETRHRRIGERLWCLAMLESWMRVFLDGRGAPPKGARA